MLFIKYLFQAFLMIAMKSNSLSSSLIAQEGKYWKSRCLDTKIQEEVEGMLTWQLIQKSYTIVCLRKISKSLKVDTWKSSQPRVVHQPNFLTNQTKTLLKPCLKIAQLFLSKVCLILIKRMTLEIGSGGLEISSPLGWLTIGKQSSLRGLLISSTIVQKLLKRP